MTTLFSKRLRRGLLAGTTLLAGITLLLTLPSAAMAGEGHGDGKPGRGRHHDPETRLVRLTETLDLSQAQQDELRPILDDQAESFRALHERKQAGESREQLREAMKAQRATNEAQIEAVLDEQQVATYRELRAERRERWAKRHKGKHKGKHKDDTGAAPEDAAAPDDAL